MSSISKMIYVKKLSDRFAYIGALLADLAFIGNALLEEGPFLLMSALSCEMVRLHGAAETTLRTWLRRKRR